MTDDTRLVWLYQCCKALRNAYQRTVARQLHRKKQVINQARLLEMEPEPARRTCGFWKLFISTGSPGCTFLPISTLALLIALYCLAIFARARVQVDVECVYVVAVVIYQRRTQPAIC